MRMGGPLAATLSGMSGDPAMIVTLRPSTMFRITALLTRRGSSWPNRRLFQKTLRKADMIDAFIAWDNSISIKSINECQKMQS